MTTIPPTHLTWKWLPQASIQSLQTELAKSQEELATQRHSDVSLQLAGSAGRNISWHADLDRADAMLTANAAHAAKATLTQEALGQAASIASDFVAKAIAARGAENGQQLLREQARNALEAVQDLFNVQHDGAFLFSEQNLSVPALKTYQGGPGQAAFNTAFMAEFGFASGDPAASTITATQLEGFLDGAFQALFDDPNWQSGFSGAAGGNVRSAVNTNQRLQLSASTNEEPVRELMAALVAATELFESGALNDGTFERAVDRLAQKVSSAGQGLGHMQGRIGTGQNVLAQATEGLEAQRMHLNNAIAASEGVDSYEVAARINGLMTQLEATFSVTSRLSRMNLLSYL